MYSLSAKFYLVIILTSAFARVKVEAGNRFLRPHNRNRGSYEYQLFGQRLFSGNSNNFAARRSDDDATRRQDFSEFNDLNKINHQNDRTQSGVLVDPSAALALGAITILGLGGLGAFGAASQFDTLRDDVNNNDDDINNLNQRVDDACDGFSNIGNIAQLTGLTGDAGTVAATVNSIINNANNVNCQ